MENINNYEYKENIYSNLDSLKLYIDEVVKIPLIEEDEEKELLEKIYNFNIKIKNKNITLEKIKNKFNKLNIIYNDNQSLNLNEINRKIKEKNSEYLNELKKLKKEVELYEKYLKLINNFMEKNLRLVISIANKFKVNSIVEFLDIVQVGNIGLREAIKRYDIHKNVKFASYATLWIKNTILTYISENKREFYIPSHTRNLLHKIDTLEKELEQKLKRKASDQELLDAYNNFLISKKFRKTNITIEQLNYLRILNEPIFSLDVKYDEEEDSLLEMLPSNINVENEAINNVIELNIKECLNKIGIKDRFIIILKYGLNIKKYMTYDEYLTLVSEFNNIKQKEYYEKLYFELSYRPREFTLEEIGNIFNVSRQAISRIGIQQLKLLKKMNLKSNLLEI